MGVVVLRVVNVVVIVDHGDGSMQVEKREREGRVNDGFESRVHCLAVGTAASRWSKVLWLGKQGALNTPAVCPAVCRRGGARSRGYLTWSVL